MSTDLFPVAPARPLAPYIGGKRNLARRITRQIEQVPHGLYVEVFAGMLGIFARRTSRPRLEIINDLSRDVSNLLRVVQLHEAELFRYLRLTPASRVEFDRLQAVDPETLTDVQRAARFLFLQRIAFGGKVSGRNFGMDLQRSRFNVRQLQPMIEAMHERLAGVVIERLPWAAVVDRYDSDRTLFYLDPPYWNCETDYGPGMFGRHEFAQMAERLARIKGRFILSLNDVPQVREIFAAFKIEGADLTYRISGRATAAKEVIISN